MTLLAKLAYHTAQTRVCCLDDTSLCDMTVADMTQAARLDVM